MIKITEEKVKTYTRDELVKLDRVLEMVPLTYDFSFKSIFNYKEKLLRQFVIDVLELEKVIDINNCKIKVLPTELPKYNKKEYKKTLDSYSVLNERIYIDIEVNTESFKDVKLRNLMYTDKVNSMLLEKGKNYKSLKQIYFYQLNLNVAEKCPTIGEDIVVLYGLKTKEVYNQNKKVVIKYLAYYRKLYYNKNAKRKGDIWLAALTSKTFTELYDILNHVLKPVDRDAFIRKVINMSKDDFILHEWEKEKLDKLVEAEKRENALNEGIEQGIEKGIEQGAKQNSIEIAKKMLERNMEINEIIEITNLTKEEIENLK